MWYAALHTGQSPNNMTDLASHLGGPAGAARFDEEILEPPAPN
jgi:hypothetical protein